MSSISRDFTWSGMERLLKVLSFLTGGAGRHTGKQAVPEFEIKREDDLMGALKNYFKQFIDSDKT